MMSRRRWKWARSGCAAAVLGTLAVASPGQDRLDPSFYTNGNAWTPEQRRTVQQYVQQQVEAIGSGQEETIAAAKNSLISELNPPGANERFVDQLGEVVVNQIRPLVTSDQLKVRLNAIIVLSNVQEPEALPLVGPALSDDNAGVRYLAAKAMANLLEAGELNDAQKQRAMDLLQQQISEEDELYVVEPMLEALLRSNDNARVLVVLNNRVAWHAANPQSNFGPEASTLRTVFSELFTASNRPQAQVREIARASTRYLRLIASQFQENPSLVEEDRTRLDLITVAASVLDFAHAELRLGGNPPPAGAQIDQRDWTALAATAQQWVQWLTGPPVNFTDQQLSIAPAPGN
jgi:hypothetical protein